MGKYNHKGQKLQKISVEMPASIAKIRNSAVLELYSYEE
jgi:hypothetical protein